MPDILDGTDALKYRAVGSNIPLQVGAESTVN